MEEENGQLGTGPIEPFLARLGQVCFNLASQ